MNIVLDTNSLIMSIAPKSPYRSVWQAFLGGDYNLCSLMLNIDKNRKSSILGNMLYLRPTDFTD